MTTHRFLTFSYLFLLASRSDLLICKAVASTTPIYGHLIAAPYEGHNLQAEFSGHKSYWDRPREYANVIVLWTNDAGWRLGERIYLQRLFKISNNMYSLMIAELGVGNSAFDKTRRVGHGAGT